MENAIETQYIYPPIPSREFDWIAYRDEDEGPDGLVGSGTAEQDAIDDLNEQIAHLEQQTMSNYKHTAREASASILRAMATNPVPAPTHNVGKFEIIRNLRGLGYKTRVVNLEDGTFNVWALAKPRIYKSL